MNKLKNLNNMNAEKQAITPHMEPPTKPLIETAEIREMAKDALLIEVEKQMLDIIHKESTLQNLQGTLDRIESAVTELVGKCEGTDSLKLEVLQKLRDKLQASNTEL